MSAQRLSNSAHLRCLLGTAALLLGLSAAFNVLVDPAGIYRDRDDSPDAYADALVASAHGLWRPDYSYAERQLKKSLARYSSRADCVVIGSSRALQVTMLGRAKSMSGHCSSILNLSVSGAAIEDHITLSYLAISNGRPQRIVLSVDPWLFAFGKDPRWSEYKEDYFRARDATTGKKGGGVPERDNVWIDKLKNLISLEYTTRSVGKVWQSVAERPAGISAAPAVDIAVGGEYPVLLPDGSVIRSAKSMVESRATPVPAGGTTYKTDGLLNQANAIEAYVSLLLWIRRQGVEPVLLMSPYHENVLKSSTSRTAVAIRKVEPLVLELGHKLNVRVIGSYDPKAAGCLQREFLDSSHPDGVCLAKLRVRDPAS